MGWFRRFDRPDVFRMVDRIAARKDVAGLARFLDAGLDGLTAESIGAAQRAIRALGEIGDPRGVPAVTSCIKTHHLAVAALEAAGELRDRGSVPAIIEYLGGYGVRPDGLGSYGDRPDECCAAARALGRIGGPEAVSSLRALLANGSSLVREAAARALSGLGWVTDLGAEGARFAATTEDWSGCARIESAGVEALIADLVAANEVIRSRAGRGLVEAGESAVEPLLAAMDDRSERLRCDVVGILGRIGGTRAVDRLVVALQDTSFGVQEAAAASLGTLGDRRAVPPLVAYLERHPGGEGRTAAVALGEIADERAIAPLIAYLQRSATRYGYEYVEHGVERALASFGQAAVREFEEALRGCDDWERGVFGPVLDRLRSADRPTPGSAEPST
jgi:HEAT repeat protein